MEQYFLEAESSPSARCAQRPHLYAMSSALTDVAGAMTTDPWLTPWAMVYYYYVNSYWLLGGRRRTQLLVDGVLPR